MFNCWEFEGDDDDVGDGVCEEMQRECNAVAADAVGIGGQGEQTDGLCFLISSHRNLYAYVAIRRGSFIRVDWLMMRFCG